MKLTYKCTTKIMLDAMHNSKLRQIKYVPIMAFAFEGKFSGR